ncbi:peptide chain release factor N(5)-glutamine methyltransferase [Alkalibacterium olivapovliticus]|uniref:Release factor glutamine methyltransferase n=1 Tax=Alkalibacterium olivapovliticus TaxID=99907 RepID=A0A2T0W5X6_9LACT|nr:peptide chain release factor N(5)-glutamine methyltransferase [Alkalibacterium olivapovliticus]PRY82105.1 release factor glutamine methyltransferase [Alkalibacterium olivapovliticus]
MSINHSDQDKTYGEVLNRASSFLKQRDKDTHIAEWLMKELFNWNTTQLITKRFQPISDSQKINYLSAVNKCATGIPPQHVVGHEWFYDRKFKVTSDTLIPRPETEEWFDRYIRTLPEHPLSVLDIGTGTGVLAISHKLERPQDRVTAVDISPEAITVAEENAKRHNADVTFLVSDLTQEINQRMDLIISNPPYISKQEKNVMDDSVILHEPHLALFAEDDGLYFYKKLAEQLPGIISPEGVIVMEYGYRQGQQVRALFQSAFPEADVTIWKDMSGNNRAIVVQLHSSKGGR